MPRYDAMRAMSQLNVQWEGSERLIDHFHEGSLQIYHDEKRRVEYIEASRHGGLVLHLWGFRVFEAEADELIQALDAQTAREDSTPEPDLNFIYPNLDLMLMRPTPTSRRFESLGLGVPGYYGGGGERIELA
jgi:hypothetical protein